LEASTVPQPGLATPGGYLTVKSSIPHPDKWSEFYQFVDANPERSPRDIGEPCGLKQAAVSRRWIASKLAQFTPGEPESAPNDAIQRIETVHSGSPDGAPTTALQRVDYRGAPSGAPGLPDIARPSDLDELKTRVSVIEAFIATLQQQPTYHPGSPNGAPVVHPVHSGAPSGSPTHQRGFVMADTLCEAIHAYATAHHRPVQDVLDLAWRRFCAQVGQEVGRA